MNSNILLVTKAKFLSATMVLADADPFNGVTQTANNLTPKFITAGLAILVLGAVITLIIFGSAGDQTRNKMKARLGWIMVAVIGIPAFVAGIPWIYKLVQPWFGA